MVHLQIVGRHGPNITATLRAAIAEARIRSFEVTRVRGGVRLKHKRYPGELRLDQTTGPLLVTVRARPESQEWQLLSAFIGRLADHFRDEISSINIQLEPNEPAPAKRKRRKARATKKRRRPRGKR